MKEIHLHIGNWRWVVATVAICATVVLASEIWSKYFIEVARIQAVREVNTFTEKNMPPAMKHAMGGMEYPLRKKAKVSGE